MQNEGRLRNIFVYDKSVILCGEHVMNTIALRDREHTAVTHTHSVFMWLVGAVIATMVLCTSFVRAGQKSGGSFEMTSDVVDAAAVGTMQGGTYTSNFVVGQPGTMGVYTLGSLELFAGFLGTLGDAPFVEVLSIAQRTDGTGNVDVSVRCSDQGKDGCKLKIVRSSDTVHFDSAATILGSSATATLTPWPDISTQEYQIGSVQPILTTSSNVVSFIWDSKHDYLTADATFYVQLTLSNGYLPYTTTGQVLIDNVSPVVPDIANPDVRTDTTITVSFGALPSPQEQHFSEYKIYYSTASSVDEHASVWDKTKDAFLGDPYFLSRTSVSISGLAQHTTYYFQLRAYDSFGNHASSNLLGPIMTTSLPIATKPAISVAHDGTGLVTITTNLTDANGDECRMSVDYSLDGGDHWYKAFVSTATASYGSPEVNNTTTYQVSKLSTSHPTPNIITIVWDSQNAGNGGGAVTESSSTTIRLVPHTDVAGEGDGDAVVADTFTVDNIAPTVPAAFADVEGTLTGSSVQLAWTSSYDQRFSCYEIWYATTTPIARSTYTCTKWSTSEDAAMGVMASTTTRVTNLQQGKTYYLRLWAVDSFGNIAVSTNEVSVVLRRRPEVYFTETQTLVQSTLGDGGVPIKIGTNTATSDLYVRHPDGARALSLAVQFSTASARGPWIKATVRTNSVTAGYGTAPVLDTTASYQIQQLMYDPAQGNLYVGCVWETHTDLPNKHEMNVWMRFSVFDGTNTCEIPAITPLSFEVDNVRPVFSTGQYTHAAAALAVYFDEVISTCTVTTSRGEASVSITNGTDTIAMTQPFIPTGTLLSDATGFICTLTEGQCDTIAMWQSLGVTEIKIILNEGAVKDKKGNSSTALSATKIGWTQDTTTTVLSSATYTYATNKLTMEFSAKIRISTLHQTGIRLQNTQTGGTTYYVQLSTHDLSLTTVNSSSITLQLTEEHQRTIAGWPYDSNHQKHLYIAVETFTASALTGNTVTRRLATNALEVLPYTYDTVAPAVAALEPLENSFSVDPVTTTSSGVTVPTPIEVTFDKRMYTGNLAHVITVRAVRDNLGNTIDTSVTGTMTETYMSTVTQHTFIFTPADAFKYNHRYEVTLKKDAQDIAHNTLTADRVWNFTTLLKAAEHNVIIAADDITLDIPKDFIQQTCALDYAYVQVSTDAYSHPVVDGVSEAIRVANNKKRVESVFNQFMENRILEFQVVSSTGSRVSQTSMKERRVAAMQAQESTAATTPSEVTIEFEYKVTGGFVDGLSNVRETALTMYWLDETHKLWVRVPTSVVDTTTKKLSAQVTYSGVFAAGAPPSTDVSLAYAYPVPYKPSEGHTSIIFTYLPSECTIRIFTISGELVKTINHTNGLPQEEWDVKSDAGNAVFSGVYIYYIKSKSNSKEGKIMIIR